MASSIKQQITQEFGVEPYLINSALVSAQNRQRFYWSNIKGVEQPEDRGILLRDVLESGEPCRGEKSYCLDANYYKGGNLTSFNKQSGQRMMVAETVKIGNIGSDSQAHRVYSSDGKAINLVANGGGQGAKTGLYAVPVDQRTRESATTKGEGQKILESVFYELSEEYYKGGELTAAGLQLVGMIKCENSYRNGKQPPQITRVYGEDGKANCLSTDTRNFVIAKADCLSQPIYEVRNGLITIKGKQYPIKLVDGFYIIRKLTVRECCRLQTMPDDYCKAVSKSQGYKGLGNGWTAEVIIHILKHANVPLDEEIVVYSFYDGIGTGRYCFDKLGYANVTYHAWEIDKYPMQIAMDNYPDIIQHGDAFQIRKEDYKI